MQSKYLQISKYMFYRRRNSLRVQMSNFGTSIFINLDIVHVCCFVRFMSNFTTPLPPTMFVRKKAVVLFFTLSVFSSHIHYTLIFINLGIVLLLVSLLDVWAILQLTFSLSLLYLSRSFSLVFFPSLFFSLFPFVCHFC